MNSENYETKGRALKRFASERRRKKEKRTAALINRNRAGTPFVSVAGDATPGERAGNRLKNTWPFPSAGGSDAIRQEDTAECLKERRERNRPHA